MNRKSDTGHIRRIEILCYASLSMLGCYLSIYQDVLADMQEEFSLGGSVTGFLIALHFIASLVSPMMLGMLADRYGRRPVLFGCFSLITFGIAVLLVGRSVWMLAAGIFIVGMGFCAMESCMSSLLSQTHPGREIQVMNISQMYFCVAAVAAPILAGALTDATGNWRTAYLVLIAFLLACAALLYFCPIPPPPAKTQERTADGHSPLRGLIRSRSYWFLLLSMLVYVGVEQGAAFWIGLFADTVVTAIAPSWFLSSYWLGMCLGRLVASRMQEIRVRFMVGGLAAAALAFGAALLWNIPALMLAMYAVVGFGIATVWPWLMATGASSHPEAPDTAAGGISTAGALGGSALLYGLGIVMDIGGTAASVACVFFLITLQAVMFSGRYFEEKRHAKKQ